MKLSILITLLGFVATACSSVCCPPAAQKADARRFLVLRAKHIPDPQAGTDQVFVDSEVLTIREGESVSALGSSQRVEGTDAPVWVASSDQVEGVLGPRARVDARPKMLALDGQTATVFVGETAGDGSPSSGWNIEVTPRVQSDTIRMAVTYRHYAGGRLLDTVPATSLDVPAGKVVIIESLRRSPWGGGGGPSISRSSAAPSGTAPEAHSVGSELYNWLSCPRSDPLPPARPPPQSRPGVCPRPRAR
jgi:hypothetical protein